MKVLHTSDWHLGKRLMKLDRSEEHEAFLNWLIDTLKSEKIDLLLIAGDIFDVPNPPHQSLELFYKFLHRISVETKTFTYIIAGNHDSGVLLEAPKELLKTHRVKVWGKLSENPSDHWERIEINGTKLDLCALPFFRSFELLPQGEGDALEALKKYLVKERVVPTILMFHHLAGVYEATGSEQVVSLSGVDSIPVDLLRTFDYVALGHIHKPQRIGDSIFYSGSPIPLRFSETAPKSVMILDVKEKITNEKLLLPVFRPLHFVKTNLENWREKLSNLPEASGAKAVVEVQMNLTSPVAGISDEIRALLEKKNMELLSFIPQYDAVDTGKKRRNDLFELGPLELFSEFYTYKYKEASVPDDVKSDFAFLLSKVRNATQEN